MSFQKRIADVNRIYDQYARSGLSNREIWRRYIYPVHGISERTFYNLLKDSGNPRNEIPDNLQMFFDFKFDDGEYYTENPKGYTGGPGR